MRSYFVGALLVLLSIFLCLSVSHAEIISIRTQGELTANTTAQLIVPANTRRKYLFVQNKGTEHAYLKFETANTGTQGILVPAGGNYENIDVPIGPAYIKTSSSTTEIFYMEGQ